MSHWNYRVLRRESDRGEPFFEIVEAYYDDAGRITEWSATGQAPFGEDADALRSDLTMMAAAFEKPVLVEQGETVVEMP